MCRIILMSKSECNLDTDSQIILHIVSVVLVVALKVIVSICKLAVNKVLGLLWGHFKKKICVKHIRTAQVQISAV